MNQIRNYQQLETFILENNLNETDLRKIIQLSNDSYIKFAISCYLDDESSALLFLDMSDNLEKTYYMTSRQKSKFIDLILNKAIENNPINSNIDAKNFISQYSFFCEEDIQLCRRLNLTQKISLLLQLQPKVVKERGLDKELLFSCDLLELSSFLNDIFFIENVLPIEPMFFVKKISKLDSVIIDKYLEVLNKYQFSLSEYFDAISYSSNYSIKGKIIINNELYEFKFNDKLQEKLFKQLGIEYTIEETDELFTEKQLGVREIDGELVLNNNKIYGQILAEAVNSLDVFKAQLFNILSTAVTTIGKVASNPKTKIAMLALSAFGVMGESFASEMSGESEIAAILNKLEKAHTLKGFEGGSQFKMLDAQLEQIGVDLNDLKFPSNFDHRTIRFYGEEGDYSLKLGDTVVSFEYNDDGNYTTTIKNIEASKGLIDSSDLKEWANKITANLNRAVKSE